MDPGTVAQILDQIDGEFARNDVPAGFPVLPRIPAARYYDEDFFNLEIEALRRCWVSVGTVHDVPDAGSYKVVDRFGGASVIVVRGNDDQIRAFYNSCQHRGAPVVRDGSGKVAKLRCQMHSWTYGLDGTIFNVPGRRDFGESLDLRDCRLRPVRCELWRGFIFINFDPDAVALVEWLGPIGRDMTWADGLRTVTTSTVELACNWKVALESNIEVYHITTLHPTTVATSLDYRGTTHELYATGHSRMVVPRLHYDSHVARADVAVDAQRGLLAHANVSYLLFPFHLTPSGPVGITLQTFWPLTAERTLLEWSTMLPDWGNDEPPELGADRNAYFDKVMEEDCATMEPVQRALRSAGFPGMLTSYHERRIYHHEASIDRLIGPDRVPEHLRIPQVLETR